MALLRNARRSSRYSSPNASRPVPTRYQRCRISLPALTGSCSPPFTSSSRREEPAPLEEMDPLTKGELFHRIQAQLQREPVKTAQLPQIER